MNTSAWFKKFFSRTNEKGAVLVTSLPIVLVLSILGLVAMMTTTTELKIAANDRSAKRVFYEAEAGSKMALPSPFLSIGNLHPAKSTSVAHL